jgi:outer membrane receptor protein involved in Fe transport
MFAVLTAATAIAIAAHAQRVEQPAITDAAEPAKPPVKVETVSSGTTNPKVDSTDDEIVEMSVFNVTASDDDQGYQALSTTSGSRLKTELKDTAASISAFTQEFLDDVGATTLDEMLAYAGNFESGTDADFDADNNTLNADNSSQFRIRGMAGGYSMDNTESSLPVDTYNIDRAEVSSGANSILFGMGAQGGTITFSSKRANVRRNLFKITNVIGTWNNIGEAWSYKRTTIDYNIVLIPRKLAFRLLGLYQNNGSWKYGSWEDTKRFNPVVTIKPFKSTTVNLSFQQGRTQSHPERGANAVDRYTGWDDAGRPVMAGFGAANSVPGTNQYSSPAYYVYSDDGVLFNYRNAYRSQDRYTGSTTNLLPEMESSVDYSSTGPGASRDQKFKSWSVVVEQRFGKFHFELGYFHSQNRGSLLGPKGQHAELLGDPNSLLSPPEFINAASTVPNVESHVGQLYMESEWQKNDTSHKNDTFRFTGEYSLRLKKLGRHRIVGMIEYATNERNADMRDEIFVDQDQVAINMPGSPNDGANRVRHRHYVTEGDYTTYYTGDGRESPEFSIGGRTFHRTYAMRKNDNSHTRKSATGYMLALQSYWLKNRLVTAFGARRDDIEFKREGLGRIQDPNDPRIINKSKVLNEWARSGEWETQPYDPVTFSVGGVYHVTSWLSPFVNHSSNRGTPYLDGRTILPDGHAPKPTSGETMDCGVILSPFRNNKITLRLTYFNSSQENDARFTPNGTNEIDSDLLGSGNLSTIYTALYDANLITREQLNAHPHYNAATGSVETKGIEAELNANVTKRLTLRLLFSYSDRNRHSLFSEIFDYYNTQIPIWMDMAQGNPELIEILRTQLYNVGTAGLATNSVRGGLNDILQKQSGTFGARPYKVTLTARYRFDKSMLKGLSLGGSLRYRSGDLQPDPHAKAQAQTMPPEDCRDLALDPDYYMGVTPVTGQYVWFFDPFAAYKRKMFGGKMDMTLRLNVINAFNRYHIAPVRYSVNNIARAIEVNAPRTIRLTCELSF